MFKCKNDLKLWSPTIMEERLNVKQEAVTKYSIKTLMSEVKVVHFVIKHM